jgi:hypothetical protein
MNKKERKLRKRSHLLPSASRQVKEVTYADSLKECLLSLVQITLHGFNHPTSAEVTKMWIYTSTPHTPSWRSA